MADKNISDILVETLIKAEVRQIYGLIGDSLNPIGNAVRLNGKLEWIGVRNEETAALAAGAAALHSGKLQVCAGTTGPGSVHLINGLYDANRNHAPVLAIVTDVPNMYAGLSYFQATTPMRLYEDCSIFCERLSTPQQMPLLLQEAMQTALDNHGVAVIIIPRDVSTAAYEPSIYERKVQRLPVQVVPQLSEIEKLADYIKQFNKITLYCGYGCLDTMPEVLKLAEMLKAPIVSTLRSKYFTEVNNPYSVGMNGLISAQESHYALYKCELLMLLGTDFPYRPFMPKTPKVIQIDYAAKHIGRRSTLEMGIHGDVKTSLGMLLEKLSPNPSSAHLEASLAACNEIISGLKQDVVKMADSHILNPEYLTARLSALAKDDAIFAVDVGLNDIWAARYVEAKPGRLITGSFKHATMAAAVPYAIGLKTSNPERQVIAMSGDGGLTMLLGDLLTVVQHNLSVKIIVYNNGEFGFINKEAEMENMPPFQTWLKNPDFAKMAEVMGIKSCRIECPQDLDAVLTEALEYDGAFLIDALTNPLALGRLTNA